MTKEEVLDEINVLYERISNPEDCENGCYSFSDGNYTEALEILIDYYEVGLIEELEKIQHEIGNEFVDLQDGSEEWRSYVNDAVLSCYEIVGKHISELKENKKGVLESIAEEQKTLLESTKAWSNYIDKNGNIY